MFNASIYVKILIQKNKKVAHANPVEYAFQLEVKIKTKNLVGILFGYSSVESTP